MRGLIRRLVKWATGIDLEDVNYRLRRVESDNGKLFMQVFPVRENEKVSSIRSLKEKVDRLERVVAPLVMDGEKPGDGVTMKTYVCVACAKKYVLPAFSRPPGNLGGETELAVVCADCAGRASR